MKKILALVMASYTSTMATALANLSILKNNKAKAIRFTTLDAICKALDCQPGDILEYVPEEEGGANNE